MGVGGAGSLRWVRFVGIEEEEAKMCIGGKLNCVSLMFGFGESVMRTFNIEDF